MIIILCFMFIVIFLFLAFLCAMQEFVAMTIFLLFITCLIMTIAAYNIGLTQ